MTNQDKAQIYVSSYSVALTGMLANPNADIMDVTLISALAKKYADKAIQNIEDTLAGES